LEVLLRSNLLIADRKAQNLNTVRAQKLNRFSTPHEEAEFINIVQRLRGHSFVRKCQDSLLYLVHPQEKVAPTRKQYCLITW
jgi:hypothetical protein